MGTYIRTGGKLKINSPLYIHFKFITFVWCFQISLTIAVRARIVGVKVIFYLFGKIQFTNRLRVCEIYIIVIYPKFRNNYRTKCVYLFIRHGVYRFLLNVPVIRKGTRTAQMNCRTTKRKKKNIINFPLKNK